MTPARIEVEGKSFLIVVWENGEESKIKLSNLRLSCPCAICKSEREDWSESYLPLYSNDQLGLKNIKIVGNYAMNLIWKDGHETGIYEFEHLREIGNKI